MKPAQAKIARRGLLLSALALSGCATLGATRGGAGQTVTTEEFDVWPGDPPGGERVTAVESVIERSTTPGLHDRAALHIRRPRVKIFRPARPDGPAMLIMPGGGYQRVVLDKEGDETALFLASHGVTCAVLIYRLPEDGWAADRDAPLQDAQRAMRLLRSGRFGVSPQAGRIGVLGFSAGGHLAGSLTMRWNVETYAPLDEADRLPARPDFSALIYPALAMRGPSPGRTQVVPEFGPLAGVTTPPVFLLHAADDATVPVQGSLDLYAQLKRAGVPSQMHVYPDGGHGFGIARAKGFAVEAWPDLLLAWGRSIGVFS